TLIVDAWDSHPVVAHNAPHELHDRPPLSRRRSAHARARSHALAHCPHDLGFVFSPNPRAWVFSGLGCVQGSTSTERDHLEHCEFIDVLILLWTYAVLVPSAS